MVSEHCMGQANNPACQRWFGEIAEIKLLAPQPVLCLVNANLQRCGDNGKAAQAGYANEKKQDKAIRLQSAAFGWGIGCGIGGNHWLSLAGHPEPSAMVRRCCKTIARPAQERNPSA